MNSLYLRSHFSDADFVDLVCPMYTSDNVSLLQKVYEWSVVDPNDIDDEKYALGKRLSEVSNPGIDTVLPTDVTRCFHSSAILLSRR